MQTLQHSSKQTIGDEHTCFHLYWRYSSLPTLAIAGVGSVREGRLRSEALFSSNETLQEERSPVVSLYCI
jgi:hypothetical protein